MAHLYFNPVLTSKKLIALLSDHFSWFGLKMHIDTGKKPSKTECIFFPSPGFFNMRTLLLTDPNNCTLALQVKESDKHRRTC